MSKHSEKFYADLSANDLMGICKSVIAKLGWAVLNQSSNTINCKETGKFDINKANFFATVEIVLTGETDNTRIELNGSVFGMGPFASKHILGEVQKLKNMIEVEMEQFKNSQKKYTNTPSEPSVALELERLASLHSQGLLSEDEFKTAKNKILGI
ncbi:MAG: SHOCT domain-containing protein [Bacteroidales bacterium]|jgi:hypothetical protein|nr:SHOCT domain-containing protein [Bacteroidales bacterium]